MGDKYIDWWLFGNRFHLFAKEITGGGLLSTIIIARVSCNGEVLDQLSNWAIN
jgi:hypothetical protein